MSTTCTPGGPPIRRSGRTRRTGRSRRWRSSSVEPGPAAPPLLSALGDLRRAAVRRLRRPPRRPRHGLRLGARPALDLHEPRLPGRRAPPRHPPLAGGDGGGGRRRRTLLRLDRLLPQPTEICRATDGTPSLISHSRYGPAGATFELGG